MKYLGSKCSIQNLLGDVIFVDFFWSPRKFIYIDCYQGIVGQQTLCKRILFSASKSKSVELLVSNIAYICVLNYYALHYR